MTDSTRRRFKLAALIALPIALVGAGLTFAHEGGWHHGPMGGDNVEMHLDHMDAMLGKIGASDAQKAQIDGILKGAFGDMKGVHDSHDAAFGQFHELLLAPAVDREKIEALRAAQIKSFDDASKRIVTAMEDAAEVLSPEQRAALAQQVRQHHGD
jgi:Spy/CpxP family protein refolding chaperone